MFAGVGERTREGNDLYREMIESGVIKLALVVGIAVLPYAEESTSNWIVTDKGVRTLSSVSHQL